MSSDYITPHEAALAVVATGMKKARLFPDVLVALLFMGGVLFTTGGMLYVMVEGELEGLFDSNPAIARLVQGALYPIGLFFVVMMGVELYNANTFYLTVAWLRGGVHPLDIAINWVVSYIFNLVGTIFVCYIWVKFSGVGTTKGYVAGSISTTLAKCDQPFHHTLIRAIVGNFYVALGLYILLLARPIHVRFLALWLPIFVFVLLGFTHTIADMYLVLMGIINGAPVGVGTAAWKVLLPGAIGNGIGGCAFGLFFPYYFHLLVVERDSRRLNLPEYEERDEQPELGVDSRVVRQKVGEVDNAEELPQEPEELPMIDEDLDSLDLLANEPAPPIRRLLTNLRRPSTGRSILSRRTTATLRRRFRSPAGVFPVLGMGAPMRKEYTLAVGLLQAHAEDETPGDVQLGGQLMRAFSRRGSNGTRGSNGSRALRDLDDLEKGVAPDELPPTRSRDRTP